MTRAECKRLLRLQQERLVREQLLPLEGASPLADAEGRVPDRFPEAVSDFVAGLSRVDRDEFNRAFDMGVPLDETTPHNSEVLILHQSVAALPEGVRWVREASSLTVAPLLPVAEATANCDVLAVALLDHTSATRGQQQPCLALLGQYESWHLQKFMRLPRRDGNATSPKLDRALPLRYVNRGAQASGRIGNAVPDMHTAKVYWEILQRYLVSFENNTRALAPILGQIAIRNTVVVMVCNFGQSELLMNFICSARRRGLDIQNVLVFATDTETYDLVTSLGVAAYYDHANYKFLPKEAAKRYADRNFRSMMLAKVFVVQMVLSLGYEVLFQDVDMVWYRNPLEYFHNNTDESMANFDIYFQDDGNHALYYAPYSANTGFYYVRNTPVTVHFFNAFLMAGETIIATKSHQVALIALLGEHASLYGLRVKIFNRQSEEFPGGHTFNYRKPFMKDVLAKVVQPYVFHMSWTLNKINKQKYFEQMGEWYFEPKCVQKEVQQLIGQGGDMFEACCAPEPRVKCHYRDKPSIIPCRDSPSIDADRGSWW